MKRKDLENTLKLIENRITHLCFEKEKYTKASKLLEKKNNEINSIRENHEKFKQDKIEFKLNMDQNINYRRHSLNKSRKIQKEMIRDAKQMVFNKNKVNSLCVKAQKKANEALLLKIQENTQKSLKIQANTIMKDKLLNKHKRSISSQQLISIRELEYEEKLNEEINRQEALMNKIDELSKIEETISLSLMKSESNHSQSRQYHSACIFLTEKSCTPDKNVPSIN